jgi:hypothetical protein
VTIWLIDAAVFVGIFLYFRKRDFQRGVEAGRLAERQWLLGVQDGVEAEREKVWREEIAGE